MAQADAWQAAGSRGQVESESVGIVSTGPW